YDDSKWKEGEGGFGTKGTPGAVVRTTWSTKSIWLRRVVGVEGKGQGGGMVRLHHDEDADGYINGVLAAKEAGYVTAYKLVPLTAAGRKALKQGKNTIAIFCRQTSGGQYIDAGLVEVKEDLSGVGK